VVERGLINLRTSHIGLNNEKFLNGAKNIHNTISVVSKYHHFLIQPLVEKDLYEWLYAFDPLVAGQIKSCLSDKRSKKISF
ncbi:unnamed protein product, partial [Adineta steineri]